MSEWISYSLHDLLIFSPESYFRLFERANLAFWPFQLVIIAISLLMLYLTMVRTVRGQLFILAGLVFFWLLSGWWFIDHYYTQINTIADWYLWLFTTEAVLLMIYAVFAHRNRSHYSSPGDAMFGVGLGIAVYSVLIHPFLILLSDRSWRGSELIAIAPDPVAIGTIGFVLTMNASKSRYGLLVIPVLWLLVSVATYSTF
ncbi:MAG: hypothetical protein KJO91_11435 [Gammaproteobacteria bacterium]|nr:hypothetical protein [Gammaproteobacteria bacterium]